VVVSTSVQEELEDQGEVEFDLWSICFDCMPLVASAALCWTVVNLTLERCSLLGIA